MPEIARAADAAGRFRLGLSPGRFRVEAFAPDGRRGAVEVEGEGREEIVIRVGEPAD